MDKNSIQQKEQLIQQIKYLKAPTCNKSDTHDEKFSVVCIDKRCDKNKQFDALCEICEIENVHKQEQHKTINIKQFLLNLAETIFEEKKSNSNSEQQIVNNGENIKNVIDQILSQLKDQNNTISTLIQGLENLKLILCQQNDQQSASNKIKQIVQNISSKSKSSEEFLGQLKQFQGLLSIQPNNTLQIDCKSSNSASMLQSLLQKLAYFKLNIDQLHTDDLVKYVALQTLGQQQTQSKNSQLSNSISDFQSGELKDEQIMFMAIILKVLKNMSQIPRKYTRICYKKELCQVEEHGQVWRKIYGVIGVELSNIKGLIDNFCTDAINWLQIRLNDEGFINSCEFCNKQIKQFIKIIEGNQTNVNSPDFIESIKQVFKILKKLQEFTQEQHQKCQEQDICKNKEVHLTFWSKLWEDAWFWIDEQFISKAITTSLDWFSEQIESEYYHWESCNVCLVALKDFRDKISKLTMNFSNKDQLIKDVCLEVLNPQLFPAITEF